MTSPKDRVRANIYKQLLQEEKRKGKRRTLFSISLFLLGMGTNSIYQMITNPLINNSVSYVATNKTTKGTKKNEISIEHFFNDNLFEEKKVELNTDELFGLNRQI